MSEEYDLSRAFERIENYLIDSMMRNFKHHRAEETAEGYNWEQWQAKQLEALEEYRRNNQEKFSTEFAELNDRVGEMLRSTADDAGYRQEQKILKAIQKGFTPSRPSSTMQASFFKLNERKMNALVRSTTDDLSRAEFAVLRRSNDAYRKAIFGAQTFMNSGAATYEQAVDMATKDMLSAGLQCVEYSNGARHTLHDYAEMAIRTANKRAYLRGEGAKMQEWGISTVIINRRHGACGRCADFVGMVFIDDVYAGGKPSDHGGKYPLLSDAMKSGLFHPRCKDSSSLYIEGISTPPDREVLPKKAQEDLTEIERAEQRAAYGKRMEKMNRRLAKYALDPDNKKTYQGRAKQWSDYTEKWSDYHKKLLEKAEKSGIIKTGLYPINLQLFAHVPKEKFTQYALNPSKDPDKARAFKNALGYTLDNYQDLIDNIQQHFDSNLLQSKGKDQYGERFEQIMKLTGPNRKSAHVCTAWIKESPDAEPRLVSAYITSKEVTT